MAIKKTEIVEIKPIQMNELRLTLVGKTPLITHAWSEKAKKQMLDAQMGKAKGKQREKKSPVQDFIDSIYWLTDKPDTEGISSEDEKMRLFDKAVENGARFGFPITAVKQAAISASYRKGWTKDKVSLKGAFFIEGDFGGGEFMEIRSDKPVMREDSVKIGMGTTDLRYRAEFENWSAEFTLSFDVNDKYDLESILNMINAGGTVCGIGEWRTEKDGRNGMYYVKPTT